MITTPASPDDQFRSLPLTANSIIISPSAVLSYLGYPEDQADNYVLSVLQDSLEHCRSLLEPAAGFVIWPVSGLDVRAGELHVGNLSFSVNKIIASQMREAKFAAVFAGTIGKGVEQLSKTCMKNGDLLESYIINSIGSEAAESVAETVHQNIIHEAGLRGWGATNRFSPGYCQWSVGEQKQLFNLFPQEALAIRLSRSSFMNPVKSVSGIIGLGPDAKFNNYPCRICPESDCLYAEKQTG